MDLTQKKLTKSEWEFLEIPVDKKEFKILKLIFNSRENVEIWHGRYEMKHFKVRKNKSLFFRKFLMS